MARTDTDTGTLVAKPRQGPCLEAAVGDSRISATICGQNHGRPNSPSPRLAPASAQPSLVAIHAGRGLIGQAKGIKLSQTAPSPSK
jgi:hypothetical protein